MRGSFQETEPRKTAEHTVKHCDGGVRLVVANHHGDGESSVVVTTLNISVINKCLRFLNNFCLTCILEITGTSLQI